MFEDLAEKTAGEYAELMQHWAAHLETGDAVTDYCRRELVADGVTGLEGQCRKIFNALDDDHRDAVAEALGGWPEVAAIMDNPDDDFGSSGWPDFSCAIETATEGDPEGPIRWEDGDAFRYPPCELLTDGEFHPDALDVQAFRNVKDPDDVHLSVALALGGPNVWLLRDGGGDRLEVYWGGTAVRYASTWGGRDAITVVLDDFAEFYAQ